jgi:hypothetical protein
MTTDITDNLSIVLSRVIRNKKAPDKGLLGILGWLMGLTPTDF